MSYRFSSTLYNVTCIFLLTGGVWNWLFKGSILASWKQILIAVLHISVLFILRSKKDVRLFWSIVGIQVALVFVSIFRGLPIDSVIYNIYFYGAWLPFYFYAKYGYVNILLHRHQKALTIFIVISAIGLIVDLSSDVFNALVDREFDNDFLLEIDSAKRAAFIFTTSTLVMPIVGMLAALTLWIKYEKKSAAIIIISCTAAAVSTATLSANIILVLLVFGIVVNRFADKSKTGWITLFGLVFVFFVLAQLQVDIFDKQLERIFTNDAKSDSNVGRLILWNAATDTIVGFNIFEHLFGLGIGVTNDRLMQSALSHGESSLFQSYIEGGFLGLYLRLLPFWIALRHIGKKNTVLTFPLFGYFIGICVAPIFGNAANQALMGTIAGVLVFSEMTRRQYCQAAAQPYTFSAGRS